MKKRFVDIIEWILAALVFILAFSVLFQILARMVFKIPASWSVEVGRAAFTAIVFLGTPLLILDDSQMCIKFIKESIKNRRATNILNVINDVFILFFEVTLAYGCYNRMLAEWTTAIPTVEWLTYGYIYAVMFIGSLLMIYCSVVFARNQFRNTKAKGGNR